jgi:hypothetical protein
VIESTLYLAVAIAWFFAGRAYQKSTPIPHSLSRHDAARPIITPASTFFL